MRRLCSLLGRCAVRTKSHVARHRHKYASAAMIYGALFYFGADTAHAIALIPADLAEFIEGNRWTGPAAALLGHLGFILERSS